ncbi:hydroxyacid oxidase 1-like [Harmonia axyridis]|uniref:hydroxyacid oxidase 1-like n=1 Tax=Harmonia axyridis TaxID=115357 RepID=UPI001E275266|nr:hydroxyacid oxidase 1-like [Harmonia axyridis]XP_045472725.1 hydroxyacid oxidase 1-like [Harmonia axyridis]XP_045472726.1 hydroxyacid oxidase 1-like [Harmonia axyridis]
MCENLASVDDFEKHAYSVLPKNALDYYRSGAGAQTTLADNKRAFSRYKLRPRILRDVSRRDLSTTVLGEKVAIPFGIAPTAMQRMANPEGELANVRAAQAMGTVYILSTLATSSIEEVAQAAPDCTKWFQLYIFKDRSVTRDLVSRAERAGFKALVLTVDAPVFGIRQADVRNGFNLPAHLRLANFTGASLNKFDDKADGSKLTAYVASLFDATLNWDDIKWLKTITKLPIILKGILTAEDAILAADAQIDGVVVSNHGARQLDGTFATIDVLEEIVRAVDNRVEVYLDGGIRSGTDVFKALALGAKMVFLGRPALWGLAHSGEEGVKKMLRIVRNEFDTALALSGCTNIGEIRRCMVYCESKL